MFDDIDDFKLVDDDARPKPTLPSVEATRAAVAKIKGVIDLLQKAASTKRPISDDSKPQIIARLDSALDVYLQKKAAKEAYSDVQSKAAISEKVDIAYLGLSDELRKRGARTPDEIIQDILKKSLIGVTLPSVNEAQQEGILLGMAQRCQTATSGKISAAKPAAAAPKPEKRNINDGDPMVYEDEIVTKAHSFIDATIQCSRRFNENNATADYHMIADRAKNSKKQAEIYKDLDAIVFEACELVHERDDLDTSKLSPQSRKQYEAFFPKIIPNISTDSITLEGKSWRDNAMKIQLSKDLDDFVQKAILNNAAARAYAAATVSYTDSEGKTQTRPDNTNNEKAIALVMPEARKKLLEKMINEIIHKAEDALKPLQKNASISRYPIEIPDELQSLVNAGKKDEAKLIASQLAQELMDRLVPYQPKKLIGF